MPEGKVKTEGVLTGRVSDLSPVTGKVTQNKEGSK